MSPSFDRFELLVTEDVVVKLDNSCRFKFDVKSWRLMEVVVVDLRLVFVMKTSGWDVDFVGKCGRSETLGEIQFLSDTDIIAKSPVIAVSSFRI